MEPVPMMHHPKKGAVSGNVTLAPSGEEPPAPPPPQPPNMAPKITRDCIDMMFTYMNYDLFIAKVFYFFFFSAFGSLFPLIAVYFKQLGLNATQSGLLIGLRPFVEFCSAPFWGNIADRFKKAKLILLFSLFCWIVFTLSLSFVKPPAHSCIVKNATHTVLEAPRLKRSVMNNEDEVLDDQFMLEDEFKLLRFRRRAEAAPVKAAKIKTAGQSPYNLDHSDYDNRAEGETSGLVTPPFSSIVYESSAVQETFAILIVLVIIGEFFSAPAITLADAAVLGYLGSDCGNYGKQRMFGSLGWGLAMFFVGIALDHSTAFPGHPCPVHEGEKDYTICFAVFSVLMAFAWLAATQFHLQLDTDFIETIPLGDLTRAIRNRLLGISEPEKPVVYEKPTPKKDTITLDKNDRLQISLDADKDMVTDAVANKEEPCAHSDTVPRWISVIKLYGNVHYGSFLFVSWYMGFGIGLVFTFLFWHLQDLGGSPTLFGIASVINHVSEIVAYFFSNKLITSLGHVRVLYIGLAGNVVRFLYISWLQNPWWVMPFELIQGLTHAAVWAAMCSYITQATPISKRSSAQGVLQGIHHGLGRGCGAIFGGIFVYSFGSELTFRGYGFTSMIVMAVFVGLNYFFEKPDMKVDETEGDEEPNVAYEESMALAPCGVPMNPLGSSLSSSRLNELDRGVAPAYGAMKSTDSHLAPAGAANGALLANQDLMTGSKNPFVNMNQQQQQQQQSHNPYNRGVDSDRYQHDSQDANGQGYQSGGHRRQLSGGGDKNVLQDQNYGYGLNQNQGQIRSEGYGYGVNQGRRDSREQGAEVTRPRRRDSGGRGYDQSYTDSLEQQPRINPQQRGRRTSGGSGSGRMDDDPYSSMPYEPSGDYPTHDEPDSRYNRMRDDGAERERHQRRDEEPARYPPTRRQDSDQGRSRREQQQQSRHDSGDYSMPLQVDPRTGRPIIPSGGFMRGGGGSHSSSGGY